MSDQQHDSVTIDNQAVALLHSATMQTGADVRALGIKIDQFINTQSTLNISQATELARLKSVDEAQQREIEALQAAPEKSRTHNVAVAGVIIGGLGFIGTLVENILKALHK